MVKLRHDSNSAPKGRERDLFDEDEPLKDYATIDKHVDRETIEVMLGIIPAQTWPARYKIHKYWGRKPANIVSSYIDFFSIPGETILDPFSGSGVTIVEGARLKRRPIGFDLNPFAVRLTNAMLSPPTPAAFSEAARQVIAATERSIAHMYVTTCDSCGGDATVRSIGYIKDNMREIRYKCPHCKHTAARPPQPRDITLAAMELPVPFGAPDEEIIFGWEMQKLKRRNVKRWSELFTHRNYCAAAELRNAILEVTDPNTREWLLLSLTAGLAQFTRMIADFEGKAGGPSWKINCYWMPDKWQELNPIWYFENRVTKSLASALDLISNGAPFNSPRAKIVDSRVMPIKEDSVDYIFTDPPYGGEGIQYGELSYLWCLWLSEKQELGAEVAFNPYRRLDQDHYSNGLQKVFSECFRVLKPGRWMTVAFANKDPSVWDCLMNACRDAGFKFVTAAPMKRSAPSLTETTMHTAPKADLILTFQKPPAAQTDTARPEHAVTYSVGSAVERIVEAMRNCGIEMTPHNVFDRVTVDWFSWFYENGSRPNAVRPTLAKVEFYLRERGYTS
ncbi:DNA methylase [Rhodovulum steppense]|uniref:site-specific DNA-methyltransferase (adenine-specific) n=1 Tax=Rhodovulum steppense TaxID=540251 RepID=A0A4R1YHD3_9RHOB|nr:DNA methylase [Rhodovulum steppense]